MFMVAFYGCLLAELIPVPIEVPLTRKVGKYIQSFLASQMKWRSPNLKWDPSDPALLKAV